MLTAETGLVWSLGSLSGPGQLEMTYLPFAIYYSRKDRLDKAEIAEASV